MTKPKFDNFENAWKDAFDEASLAPPNHIWENIASALPKDAPSPEKPGEPGLSMTNKLIISAGVFLISSITYLFITNSLTNTYNSTLNTKTDEKHIKKPVEPTIVETNVEKPKLVITPSFIAKTQIKKSLPINLIKKIEANVEKTEIVNNVEVPTKIEIVVTEIVTKQPKLKKLNYQTPDLIFPGDSQESNQYYVPLGVPFQENTKGRFWENIKIRGGVRLSN